MNLVSAFAQTIRGVETNALISELTTFSLNLAVEHYGIDAVLEVFCTEVKSLEVVLPGSYYYDEPNNSHCYRNSYTAWVVYSDLWDEQCEHNSLAEAEKAALESIRYTVRPEEILSRLE